MKLAFDPILRFVGILNLGEKRNWIYPLSIVVWSGSYLAYPMWNIVVDLLPDTSFEEAHLFNLIHLDETCREAWLANEAHKRLIKAQYDKHVQPHIFSEGDLVLLCDHEADVICTGKFEPLWHGPYIFKRVLAKGAYELVDYDGILLA